MEVSTDEIRLRRPVLLFPIVLGGATSYGHTGVEQCGAEIKLLLLPTEVHSAMSVFRAGKSTISSVYFFDTNALDLLSEGLISRLRIGGISDLTVKLRSRANIAVSDWLKATKRYKCEDDLTGEMALRSYSIQTKFFRTLPQTGNQLFEQLNAAQKRLLEQAHVSIDWSRIRRIGEIKSTDWKIRKQSPFSKLVLELWEWRTGKILELSTKVVGNAGPSTQAQLLQIAVSHGLSPNKNQTSKTAVALEDIIHTSTE